MHTIFSASDIFIIYVSCQKIRIQLKTQVEADDCEDHFGVALSSHWEKTSGVTFLAVDLKCLLIKALLFKRNCT